MYLDHIQVALSGLENVLSYGEAESQRNGGGGVGQNPYAIVVEECYGLDKIEFLQSHEVCKLVAWYLEKRFCKIFSESSIVVMSLSCCPGMKGELSIFFLRKRVS